MLKTLIAASAVTLITAMSGPSASMQSFPFPTNLSVEKPPVQFQGPPDAPASILYADPIMVDAVCRRAAGKSAPAGGIILACTLPSTRRQLMPDPCLYPDEYFASLQCHENAHLPRSDGSRWVH